MTEAPKKGSLQVWWIPQVPMEAFNVSVESAEQGAFLLNVLAEYDAFQFLNGVKPDYCNSGGLSVFEGGEWCDWYGGDFEEYDDPLDVYPQPSIGWCANLNDEDATK